MGGSHDVLHHAGDSPVHRLAPHVKILVAFGAVLGVVATCVPSQAPSASTVAAATRVFFVSITAASRPGT